MNQELVYLYHSSTHDQRMGSRTFNELKTFKTYQSAQRAFLADLAFAEDQTKAQAFAEKLARKTEPFIDEDYIEEWGAVTLETFYGKFPSGAWYLELQALPLQ